MNKRVDGGTSCALPATPMMRVSHTVSEMRQRRGEAQRRGEKRRRRRRRRRSAQTPPRFLRGSLSTAPHVGCRERNKAGRKQGSSERTMAQTRSSQLRTVSDRSAPSPQSSPARITQLRTRSGSR